MYLFLYKSPRVCPCILRHKDFWFLFSRMLLRDWLRLTEYCNELISIVLTIIFIVALARTTYFHGNLRWDNHITSEDFKFRCILYCFSLSLIGANTSNICVVFSTQLRGLEKEMTNNLRRISGSYERRSKMFSNSSDSRIYIENLFLQVGVGQIHIINRSLFRELLDFHTSTGYLSREFL